MQYSSISFETKLRVYQASVLSVLLYGSECWPISTSLCSRLSAFDMQAQPTITNTKWFDYKTNIEVRALTKRQPIQRYIGQSRLRWFGHLLRSPHNHPAHAIYSFNPRAEGWLRPRDSAWRPSHAMGWRPRQRPQTAGDNTGRGFQHHHRPYPLEVNHCCSCRLHALVARALVSEWVSEVQHVRVDSLKFWKPV